MYEEAKNEEDGSLSPDDFVRTCFQYGLVAKYTHNAHFVSLVCTRHTHTHH